MKRTGRKIGVLAAFGLGVSLISGCGCGTAKTVDEASEQVMKITIAPEVTPTPAPSEVNSKAVVTNGNLTMVNEYLAGDGSQSTDGSTGDGATAADASGTEDTTAVDAATGDSGTGDGTTVDGTTGDSGTEDGTTVDGTTGDSGIDGTTDGTEVDSESYDEESQE